MSDASLRWISPNWQVYDSPAAVRVAVLNPHAEPVKVKAYWFNDSGKLFLTNEQTIEARSVYSQFGPVGAAWLTRGWVRIVGEKPVIPWGVTPWGGKDMEGMAQMTFYREDAVLPLPLPTP